jgi:ERF superfamily
MTDNKELFAAMAKAFEAIGSAAKDSTNPHFKSKYADLGAVVDAIKPALTANGLWFAQVNHEQTGGVCVETIVCHASGAQMSFGKLFVPASKQDAQGYGSALTYARRYSLLTAFGVCSEDDDGNAVARATREAPKVECLGPAEISELQGMIEGYGFKVENVCKAYKIASLKEIPLEEFANVKASLNKKYDAQKAKEQAQ